MNILSLHWAPAVMLSVPLFALAQQRAEPPGPKASAPALRYQSAFADYRPWQDIPPGDWRQLNAALAPTPGGASAHASHAGHAAGGSGPAAPALKGTAAAVSTHQGHQGHQAHQGQHKHGAKQ